MVNFIHELRSNISIDEQFTSIKYSIQIALSIIGEIEGVK